MTYPTRPDYSQRIARRARSLLPGLIALAALIAGVRVGEVLASPAGSSVPTSPAARASHTTDVGQLNALGFTESQAKRLLSQFESGPGTAQRTAAEAIAMTALWGPMASPRHPHPAGGLDPRP